MPAKKFTWVETHKGIVQYLLKNEKNQQKLIDLLQSVGITGFDDESKPGKKIPLTEIDPFTFFCFIYKHRSANRLRLLQEIAKKLSLPVPEDDFGIPSAQALKVWLFPFKYDRNNNEVARLWSFFKKALKDNLTQKDFEDVLTISGTGKTKLTEGLFNIAPERFLPINKPMKPYLNEVLRINPDFQTLDEYLNILARVSQQSKKPFYELSSDAYIWNSNPDTIPDIDEPVNETNKKYWLYSPGRDAGYWDEFYSNGIMGLGWDELGDLQQYKTKNDLVKELQKLEKTDSSKKNDSGANFDFCYSMAVGDVVIVKKGRTKYLGYGIVTSEYIYDTTRAYYQHIRKVDWKIKGVWTEDSPIVLKTLTDITKYPEYVEKLIALLNINIQGQKIDYPLNVIFYGPPGTGKTYNTIITAAEIVSGEKGLEFNRALEIYKDNLHDTIEFITFHQNYSYEDFIQGLRPDLDQKGLAFERKDGIFKVIADRALKNLRESSVSAPLKQDFNDVFEEYFKPYYENGEMEITMKKSSFIIKNITDKYIDFDKPQGTSHHTLNINSLKKMYENGKNDIIIGGLAPYYQPILEKLLAQGNLVKKESVKRKNYVLIIDEINRANISRVFGELITLIECDKRSNGKIPMNVKLPSGESFCVPSNLYIIGTMNTADKSIALLDIALRRRFEFKPMYPDYSIKGLMNSDILRKINEQIITMKGHDFQIGHSFFMGDDYDLTNTMNCKVIPLLLEYFMNKADEVIKILKVAGLKINDKVWPIQIEGIA